MIALRYHGKTKRYAIKYDVDERFFAKARKTMGSLENKTYKNMSSCLCSKYLIDPSNFSSNIILNLKHIKEKASSGIEKLTKIIEKMIILNF